jgi:hypothetical protein
MSLVTILDELKDRPVTRGSDLDIANGLAKKVKGVDLNSSRVG